ncbi:DNA mismatch repair protein Mlh1 [Hordeum vulgare]|nr:DNA mismatch repair protein Mlh1 [Hordeum vulgare]
MCRPTLAGRPGRLFSPGTPHGVLRRRGEHCRPALLRGAHPEGTIPKGFTLARDTPKYNGSTKHEDWLTDYTTVVGIDGSNKHVAVRYAPLMLLGSVRTWLNSLPADSVNG